MRTGSAAAWPMRRRRPTPQFGIAEGLLRGLGIPFWLAVARLEHAEALVAHGGEGDVRALLDAAREDVSGAPGRRPGSSAWMR